MRLKVKNPKAKILLGFVLLLGLSNFFGYCMETKKINFINGNFPETPVNFSSLNSIYDDYNSGPPPTIEGDFNFYYSSNKNSEGKQFDILGATIFYHFDQEDGDFTMTAYEPDPYGNYEYLFFDQLKFINTKANEFGPNFSISEQKTNFLFYSSDTIGKQHIYCLIHEHDSTGGTFKNEGPFPVNILNSQVNQAEDGYLTIDSTNRTIYFMSNRDGNFDIFKRTYPANLSFKQWLLTTSSSSVQKVTELSTQSDDKCPYINGRLMVFSSNRAGGYGGFDLWYSILENGVWSEPKNFGAGINSQSDEYRPVVMTDGRFTNDMLIFSSNRTGGKGGFDLYYVGIPKMTK